MADTPRVWIACLAAYNEGHLHGKWVDAIDVDELNEAAEEVIKTSPALYAEEFAIHDYDGFGSLPSQLGEYPSLETVARIGAAIEEEGEAYLAYLEACEVDLNDAEQTSEEAFREHYRGEWDSEEDYAYYEVQELGWGGVPAQVNIGPSWQEKTINVFEELSSYLDWESIARELFQHGTMVSHTSPSYKVYVFETNV